MTEDWRLRIHLHDPGRRGQLVAHLEAAELEHELHEALPERIAVSHDEDDVFCYTATRRDAERAGELVRRVAARNGWRVETELARWHPVAEGWEDPDDPLPATGDELAAEHAELLERERLEARERGYPEFEVRVRCRSRTQAVELAERLEARGIPSLRRWHYLLIGAADEDAAEALAQRIGQELPDGAEVSTEATGLAASTVLPGNPFAIFGGMGG